MYSTIKKCLTSRAWQPATAPTGEFGACPAGATTLRWVKNITMKIKTLVIVGLLVGAGSYTAYRFGLQHGREQAVLVGDAVDAVARMDAAQDVLKIYGEPLIWQDLTHESFIRNTTQTRDAGFYAIGLAFLRLDNEFREAVIQKGSTALSEAQVAELRRIPYKPRP